MEKHGICVPRWILSLVIEGTRAAAVVVVVRNVPSPRFARFAGVAWLVCVVVVVGFLGCVDPAASRARVRLAAGAAIPPDDAPAAFSLGDAPAGVELFDLGLLAMNGGKSADVLVDVDDAVRSFTLLVSAHEEAFVVVDRVADPTAALVVDPAVAGEVSAQVQRLSRGFAGPFLSRNRMLARASGGAFAVPSTPALSLSSGTWRARVAQGVVDVDAGGAVLLEPLDRPLRLLALVDTRLEVERARLAIALHFTGAGGLSAANASSSALVQGVLSTLQQTFEPVGVDVDVGAVGLFDVDDAFAIVELAPDLCDGGELSVLLRALEPTPGVLDVVLVDRLRCTVRGDVVVDGFAGLAAAIPGDGLLEGAGHGGLALALGVVADDPQRAGVVVAHEVGHLLGLFHTMEQASGADPLVFDVVADTPDDPLFSDNLMTFDPETSTSLTPEQGALVRLSPWLQHASQP
jgi:hypothetical protein